MIAATRSRLALLAFATLAGLAVGGCDRDSASERALRQANEQLVALTPDGMGTPSMPIRHKTYNDVITVLRPVADRGTAGQNASANLLIAQAQCGLGEAPAWEASSNERAALNEIQGVRDSLSQYLTLSALSEAAAKFDPTAELNELDKQIKEKDGLRVTETQRKAAIDAQVADLQAQAKTKADLSRVKRQEAGGLKSGMTSQSATQAEATLRQAAEISRVADALDVESSNLEARAAQIAPQSGEAQLQIDRLANQKTLLEKARADVQKRAQTAKANAADAAATAATAAEALKKSLATLDERRSTELAKASDDALAAYRAAAAAAKKATAEARGPANMVLANAQQAVGDLSWNRAHGLNAYAELLESIAGAKPPLPDAAAAATKAQATRAAMKEALDAATAAYQDADKAYQAGGTGGPEIKARIERINARLSAIVKATSGGSVDLPLMTGGEAGDQPPATPATPAPEGGAAKIDPGSPNATAQALFDMGKSGDYAGAADLFYTSSDQEKALLTSVFGMIPSMKKLDDACKAKFGKTMTEAAAGAAGSPVDLDKFKDFNAAGLQFAIQGDAAEAPLPNGQTLKLRQKDGKWLVDGASMGLNMQQMGMVAVMAPALTKAAGEVTADIESGKITSVEAAIAALQQKAAGALGGAPKPGGG